MDVAEHPTLRVELEPIADGILRGAIAGTDAAQVQVIIADDGGAELCALTAVTDGAAPKFEWPLPPTYYDGRTHVLNVEAGGAVARAAFLSHADVLLPPPLAPAKPVETQMPANMQMLVKQAETLRKLLDGSASRSGRMARRAPLDIYERYGVHFGEATRKRTGRDYVWFGVINYNFRIQRPQHLAMELADLGNRVFYVSINFEPADDAGKFRIESMPHEGVFLLRLRLTGPPPKNIYGGFTQAQEADIAEALDEALLLLNVTDPVAVVQYPSWHRIAAGVPGATVVHDCLDYIGGFSNVSEAMVTLERELMRTADLVITTSEPLAEHVREFRETTIIRNAADVDFFASAARFDTPLPKKRPLIGYFGAIAEWYHTDWIEQCAQARPDWEFVLIGQTVGADVTSLQALANVKLLGEKPYDTLPDYLCDFDVAIIPFVLNDLIRCTNPVKLYEYMAAGKPVVASPMPEVVKATPLVYVASTAAEFEAQIKKALAEDSPTLRRARNEWAREHTWTNRALAFTQAVAQTSPRVSVVVLAYNNWAYTKACLQSVLTESDYNNFEVIVVDNGSTDETIAEVERIARRDSRVRLVANGENLGFAAGNNAGIKAASGEYVILLNNDTYVTRGWIRDLIRPLIQDPCAGLCGPLTNNIGNEQKIELSYADMHEMTLKSRTFTRAHSRERYEIRTLAFFCVAIRRDVIETIGLLDERYGRGFFEDDDYCNRAREAGYTMLVADDVFVHHRLSASFSALGNEEKQAQMERNKAIYEQRWGKWTPHVYRDAPGFG